MKKKNSRESYLSIRQKLIAAVAMLLVATFMVASSSYAWFTLSTAPEVTGIKTSVGANGSLEIALVPKTATVATITNDLANITAGVGDSNDYETWGNLVDLSNEAYGLNNIRLNPSVIIVSASGEDRVVDHDGAILATPTYGPDGRVVKLNENAVSGKYDTTAGQFKMDSTMGVTAIGTASSMTQQQLDYMNAGSKLTTSLADAKRAAENALSNNGQGLVQIILGYVGNATTYDIAAIGGMVETLNTVPGHLEDAMMYYIIMCAAKAKETTMNDNEFVALKNAIITDCEDGSFPVLSGATATIAEQSFEVPAMLQEVYTLYSGIKTAIQSANDKYTTAKSSATVSDGKVTISGDGVSTTVRDILSPLMDVDDVTVNGYKKSEINSGNMGTIGGNILSAGGVVVDMPKDSGVFADIAQESGQVSATFTYSGDVTFGSLSLSGIENLPINMKTSISSGDFKLLTSALPGDPVTREDADAKLSTLYGYSIDFAFRTNAVSSNLMLQTTPANRIYASGGSTTTQGNGSTMTFEVIDNSFTTTDIQRLMSHIRIVFTDANGKILSGAKLDTSANAVVLSGNSVTAPIKLCIISAKEIPSGVENSTISTLNFGDMIEPDINGKTEITSLAQNTPTAISVYVYLDGETIQNSDVGSTLAESTRGTMNLQFSSDANLVPMDYAEFKDPNAASGNNATTNVTITKDSLASTTTQTLTVGQTLTLPTTNAADVAITWTRTTGEDTVATLSGNTLTTVGAGSVTLTYASSDNAVTGTLTVTVNAAASSNP